MTALAIEDRLHTCRTTSFAGVACAQYFVDFYVWEAVLNERTGADTKGFPALRAIVELGTFKGGFSLYLATQANERGLLFRTYDVAKPDRAIPGFVQLDIFAKAEAIGAHLVRSAPVILLCDGGNKPRELRTFSRYLDHRSILAVHDWGSEIDETDVPDDLTMIYGDFCEELGSITRFFVKDTNDA